MDFLSRGFARGLGSNGVGHGLCIPAQGQQRRSVCESKKMLHSCSLPAPCGPKLRDGVKFCNQTRLSYRKTPSEVKISLFFHCLCLACRQYVGCPPVRCYFRATRCRRLKDYRRYSRHSLPSRYQRKNLDRCLATSRVDPIPQTKDYPGVHLQEVLLPTCPPTTRHPHYGNGGPRELVRYSHRVAPLELSTIISSTPLTAVSFSLRTPCGRKQRGILRPPEQEHLTPA